MSDLVEALVLELKLDALHMRRIAVQLRSSGVRMELLAGLRQRADEVDHVIDQVEHDESPPKMR